MTEREAEIAWPPGAPSGGRETEEMKGTKEMKGTEMIKGTKRRSPSRIVYAVTGHHRTEAVDLSEVEVVFTAREDAVRFMDERARLLRRSAVERLKGLPPEDWSVSRVAPRGENSRCLTVVERGWWTTYWWTVEETQLRYGAAETPAAGAKGTGGTK